MKLADHLSKETIRKFNQLRQSPENKNNPTTNSTTKKKKTENLSRKDLEDLMGTRRDIYTRRNGAVRRK